MSLLLRKTPKLPFTLLFPSCLLVSFCFAPISPAPPEISDLLSFLEFSSAIRYGRMHSAFEILKYEPDRALERDADNVMPLHWAALVPFLFLLFLHIIVISFKLL